VDGITLSAVAQLADVAKGVKLLRFELQWDNPITGRDYLDGSCFLFSDQALVALADYRRRNVAQGARHGGDVPRGNGWIHVINIDTTAIPDTTNYLFFSLSAYNSPTIGVYPNPGVKIFEPLAGGGVRDLGGYGIARAGDQQAVVMCAMYRGALGWRVVEVEKFCAGNAKDYSDIKRTCQALVASLTFA